jgi:hypothetical protein
MASSPTRLCANVWQVEIRTFTHGMASGLIPKVNVRHSFLLAKLEKQTVATVSAGALSGNCQLGIHRGWN